MKSLKHIAFGAFVALGTFFTVVTYSSCDKDKCKDVVCQNGGTCNEGTCTCSTGYEGTNCETASRTKFIKSWSASDVTGSSTYPYTVAISASTGTDVTQVVIGSAFSDGFFVNPINATVSGTTITIASQKPDNTKYSVSGTGTYANSKISWTYTIKNDSSSATQNYTGTWQ